MAAAGLAVTVLEEGQLLASMRGDRWLPPDVLNKSVPVQVVRASMRGDRWLPPDSSPAIIVSSHLLLQ